MRKKEQNRKNYCLAWNLISTKKNENKQTIKKVIMDNQIIR